VDESNPATNNGIKPATGVINWNYSGTTTLFIAYHDLLIQFFYFLEV